MKDGKPTSNCHLIKPKTPQCTRPEWIPTRMSTFTAITSRTNLYHTVNTESKKNVNDMRDWMGKSTDTHEHKEEKKSGNVNKLLLLSICTTTTKMEREKNF